MEFFKIKIIFILENGNYDLFKIFYDSFSTIHSL